MKKIKGQFWAIPKEIMDNKNLSIEARVVYGVLWTRTNGDNESWPGQKYIAENLGFGVRSIKRYLKELEEAKMIEIERRGLRKTNKYILMGQVGTSRGATVGTSRGATVGTSHSKRRDVREEMYNTPQPPKGETPNGVQILVNYFFELKNWHNKDKDFYEKNRIIYGRYVRPAKQLLFLCDNDVEEAKICLKKISEWAISNKLDWSIETIFKKWYDIDYLKPKEKKPYIDGKRAFQRVPNGRWYVVSQDGEIREYGAIPEKVEWK